MSEKLTLFDRFGGTRRMGEALAEPPSTVQSWKTAGRIPAHKQPDVLAKAKELGLDVTPEDIIFPLGRPDTAESTGASANKLDESIGTPEAAADIFAVNICDCGQVIESEREADSHGPFSASPSTCSTTREPSGSFTNPTSSTGGAKAA